MYDICSGIFVISLVTDEALLSRNFNISNCQTNWYMYYILTAREELISIAFQYFRHLTQVRNAHAVELYANKRIDKASHIFSVLVLFSVPILNHNSSICEPILHI